MKKIVAKEFDEKFDNSEDISEHLDFSKSIKLKDFLQDSRAYHIKPRSTKVCNQQNMLNFNNKF